ncbi:hypothetical protein MRX96_007103 [Rhipicephalus microplus]
MVVVTDSDDDCTSRHAVLIRVRFASLINAANACRTTHLPSVESAMRETAGSACRLWVRPVRDQARVQGHPEDVIFHPSPTNRAGSVKVAASSPLGA